MTNLSPEQLKQIAEWMGYEAKIECFEGCSTYIDYTQTFEDGEKYACRDEYNPAESPAQLVEIEKKLLNNYGELRIDITSVIEPVLLKDCEGRIVGRGETLEDAVLAAAWEIVSQ